MDTASPPPPPLPSKQTHSSGVRMLLPVDRTALAIVAGYLGLFSVLLLPAPASLIVSILAIRDLRARRASGHPKCGMGRAVFGLIMGALGTLVLAVSLLSTVWSN